MNKNLFSKGLKGLLTFMMLFLAFFANAQSADFNSAYAVLNVNGTANKYYKMKNNPADATNPVLNGAVLGNFNAASTLQLQGAEHNVYKCGGCDLTSTRINYRVYKTGTTPGAFSNLTIGNLSSTNNGCGGADQQWKNTGSTINLLSGLTSGGNYTLEVYSDATITCGSGTAYDSNGGSNYKATFTYCGPTTGALPAGNYAIPGCFATVQAAVSYINTNGITGTGNVVFDIAGGSPAETAPAGGITITATGTATNQIIFQKVGAGAYTITAPAQTAGNLNDAIIKIVGGDYITIDGLTLQENTANTTTAAATNNMTEWGVALLYASTTNGSQNNTIKNCNISLNRTYLNTFGIYSNTRHSSTAVTTLAEVTSAAGSNSNNKIYTNSISNVNFGIVFIGAGTTIAAIDSGNDIGGSSSATGNTITNWGGGAALSAYTSLTANNYCIFMNQQINDNVSFNTITSAALATSVTEGGILKNYSVASPTTGTITSTINNNTVTVTNNPTAATTGQIIAINNQGLTPLLSTATMSMNNNTVQNCVLGGATSTTNQVLGITNLSLPGTLNMNGNAVIGSSITATSSTTGINAGITNSGAAGTVNMNNNIVRGLASTSTSGQIQGVVNSGAVTTALNINNNQFGNASGGYFSTSTATSGTLFGISNAGVAATCAVSINGNDIRGITHNVAVSSQQSYISNASTSSSVSISNNTFTNLNINTTGTIYLINNNNATNNSTIDGNSIVTGFKNSSGGGIFYGYYNFGSPTGGTSTISNNNFSNITLSGATTFYGVYHYTLTAQLDIINNNTITNVSGTSSPVYGIRRDSGATNSAAYGNTIGNISTSSATNVGMNINPSVANTGTYNLYKNKIYDLTSSNTVPTVYGISVTNSGTTLNIFNNTIGNLTAPAASNGTTDVIRGISLGSTSATSSINVYYNTIYLNATSSGANFTTSGLYHTYSTTVTTAALDLRNNIIINKSTPKGTGLSVAFRRSAATNLSNYKTTSNNNLFYAGTPSAANLIYYDGTNSDQTLTAFQTRVTTRETVSQTEDTTFQSTTGSNANFLRIADGTESVAESGAQPIATITDDYWNTTRPIASPVNGGSTTNTDIGASEFDGIPKDNQPPTITYTALSNTCTTGAVTLTATITDAVSGVPTSGTGLPVAYFKINSGSYTAVTGTYVSGSTYTFDIGTGSASGDIVSYYIVAQDKKVGTPNVGSYPSAGASGFTANPPAASTPPTTPSSYTVIAPNGGTASATPATLCISGTSKISATGYAVGSNLNYQWQSSTDNFVTDIQNIGTAGAYADYNTPTISSTMYYRLKVTCTATSTSSTSTIATVTVNNPAITGTTGETRCGIGTVNLNATGSAGTTLNWYAGASGGASLGTGDTFTTPTISNTTDYWVEASIPGSVNAVGKSAPATTDTNFITTNWGIVFDVANTVKLTSVDLYASTGGTVDIKIMNAAMTTELYSTGNVTLTAGGTTTPNTIPLNYTIAPGTGYRILIKAFSGASLIRSSSGVAFPYNSSSVNITSSEWGGTTTSTYYFFYNLKYQSECTSTRTKVTATVTPAPAITLSTNAVTICSGDSTPVVTLTSATATTDYSDYTTWSPSTGVSGNATTGWTFNPTTTTTYTLTGKNAAALGCVNTATITVTVNPSPAPVTLAQTVSPAAADNCSTDYVKLDAHSGNASQNTLINENFEGATITGWTTSNLSTGGTPANAAWKVVASPYAAGATTINNGSKFAISDSDSQGSGGTTETYLDAPVIDTRGFASLSLNFDQYFRYIAGSSAVIFVSTDNVNWTNVKQYNANQGTATAFLNTTIDLSAYVNQPTVYISFGFYGSWDWYWALDNIKVTGTPLPIIWSPTTGLYTDSALTTPYTGGNAATVYAAPDGTETYTATATIGTCYKNSTATVTRNKKLFTGATDNNWNVADNWFPKGVPTNTKCVFIPSLKTAFVNVSNAEANKVTVENGGKLTINANQALTVTNEFKNLSAAADVMIESDGNLLQTNEDVNLNTGDISAKRAITITSSHNQYNYLISPLVGGNLRTGVYEGTDSPMTTYYNETNNYFYSSSGVYIRGRGLAVKEPATGTGQINVLVKGVPANGAFTYTLANTNTASTGYNLLGNPYPSSIDLDLFYNLNTNENKLSSTFYFWDNTVNAETKMLGSGYNGAAYAVFNAAAGSTGTGNGAGYLLGTVTGAKVPTANVKTGQGFIVRSISNTDKVIDYNNTIRIKDAGTGFFGNATKPSATKSTDDRYWLNLKTPANIATQVAIVYFGNGNNAFSKDDSEMMGNPSDVLYTIIGDKKAIINGRAPFVVSDVIPLGSKHFEVGEYTFSLGAKEGVFNNGQNIYLNDKQNGVVTNLSEGNYSFSATAGEITGRFEIVYDPQTILATGGNAKEELQVYRDGTDFVVKAQSKKITNIEVFDGAGRLIYQLNPNSTKGIIDAINLNSGMYVLKIYQKGEVTTRKVLK